MKVIRALQTIYIPKTPEYTNESSVMFSQVDQGELALIADSFIHKLNEGSYLIYANVNPKFKRKKKAKHEHMGN